MKMIRDDTKRIVYGGALIALGVIFPQLFHIFGSDAGRMFLPMHIPVLLAGFLLGPVWGLAVGVIVPILSSIITGMPAVPMLYFMLFELMAYAAVSGLLMKRMNIYLALICTMLCGRVVYALALIVAVNMFGMNFPFASTAAFFGGLATGLPGVLLQLVFIPPVLYALKKGGLTLGAKQAY